MILKVLNEVLNFESILNVNIELANYFKSLNINNFDTINIDYSTNNDSSYIILTYSNKLNISDTTISSKSTIIKFDNNILKNILDNINKIYLNKFTNNIYCINYTLDKLYRLTSIFPRFTNEGSFMYTYNIIVKDIQALIEKYYKEIFYNITKHNNIIQLQNFKMNMRFICDLDYNIKSLNFSIYNNDSLTNINYMIDNKLKYNILLELINILHKSSQLYYYGMSIDFDNYSFKLNLI